MKRIYIIGIALIINYSLLTNNCSAQTWVTIPDANFVTYLQSIIPAAMSGNQMDTSSALVTTTTHSINVQSLGIANISGVQYFTSLTYLNCNGNSLASLPALPNSLTYLNCSSNSLAVLLVLPTSLTYLDCGYTHTLTTLPALPTSLQALHCDFNFLTTLPALPDSLISLECSSNHLTSLPALPNTLIILVCEYNSLITLPALPNSLQSLDCANNNITCFPTFPNSIIGAGNLSIDPNPYNCLPNHIAAMSAYDATNFPICAAGNSNGCPVATGIQQFANSNEVSIYPNPASTIINLKISQFDNLKMNSVEIYNTIGECILHQIVSSANFQIDVADLSEGVYNLQISTSSNLQITKKVVIVR
ncbi:MAG: T9SS type A sorting domain-containing protein [Bacteroidia bacterium]